MTIRALLGGSPALVRVAPFVVFLLLTWLQGKFGEASRYWLYLGKTILGGAMLWTTRPWLAEVKWKWSLAAVVTGTGVFALWVGLDGWYPSLDQFGSKVINPVLAKLGLEGWALVAGPAPPVWNPELQFGAHSGSAWFFIAVRMLGSSVVVPPLEEVFYRSFLYRYLKSPDFLSVPLGWFAWAPFLLTSVLFGVAHVEWLPGILCGFAYQGLVCWKKRLDDAVAAHALTNLLLGVWVVWQGAWHFW